MDWFTEHRRVSSQCPICPVLNDIIPEYMRGNRKEPSHADAHTSISYMCERLRLYLSIYLFSMDIGPNFRKSNTAVRAKWLFIPASLPVSSPHSLSVSPAEVPDPLTGCNFTPRQLFICYLHDGVITGGEGRFPNSRIRSSVTLLKENKPNNVSLYFLCSLDL